ncbi:hypothetical protein F66182_6425 [Fusarium sp. NRRL 66182]|nr:hypothetical protein F66182_6425 [Fusarium sp. NRRL 66182]
MAESTYQLIDTVDEQLRLTEDAFLDTLNSQKKEHHPSRCSEYSISPTDGIHTFQVYLISRKGSYEYLLFTYKLVTPPNNVDPSMAFIFTGSEHQIGSPSVQTNTFIKLEDLSKRIGYACGNKEALSQLFLQDWLTFLAHTDNHEGVPDTLRFGQSADVWLKSDTRAHLKEVFDGSHLLTSNNVGKLKPTKDEKENGKRLGSIDFLVNLLQPAEKDHLEGDILRYIFSRWCGTFSNQLSLSTWSILAWLDCSVADYHPGVAYNAAFAVKEPFSVKARFAKLPKDSDITFVYGIDEIITSNIKTLSAGTKGSLRELAERFIAGKFNNVWHKDVEAAHEAVKNKLGLKISQKILPHGEPSPKDHKLLSHHPQLLYTVYVSEDDYKSIIEAMGFEVTQDPFKKPERPHPISEEIARKINNEMELDPSSAQSTRTSITSNRTTIATNQPRCKTQAAVMNGHSAGSIAKQLCNFEGARTAEWLHRSAYSFGGIDVKGPNGKDVHGGPDSSQEPGNLVFGTYECNTNMIRYESFLKRLACDLHVEVVLRTSVQCIYKQDIPWLASTLFYTWEFKLKEDGDDVCVQRQAFDLFSQMYPSLYEVEMDEEFDKRWMKSPLGEDDRSKLVELILFFAR